MKYTRRPWDTLARWIALTTLVAMLTLLALNALFSQLADAWARPPLMETGLIEKVAAITRIIDSAAPEQRPTIARTASDQTFNTQWLQRHEDAKLPAIDDPEYSDGALRLRQQLGRPDARIEGYEPSDWAGQPGARYAAMIELTDHSWVEFSLPARSWGLEEWERSLIMLALILVSTIIVALIATRHLAAPLERFAEGARRFGVDHQAPPIPVIGPHEIRQAILAFNAMQAQLKHFLQDRTQMLAAISHDLRAPLTRMRLRGEFIEDAEQQSRLFRDVDEMQAMINSALEFFRDDARLEHATAFDLAELLHTIVDDLKDAGTDIGFDDAQRLVYVGRPIGIKRALVNLIDNAIKYAGAPTVRLEANANRVDIRILDRGPGIAAQHLEQVFTPFFRIEGSRNKHTGGVGLGLSAARATVLEHGGTLTLRNRRGGGLEARVSLPLD
ncbi:sensor histidine kinase [Pseudomonas brassicacearum]|uniref:sensor histidine kinase n=1 Tax=Pseudomonas brassicacearum TaxID=930166 RepID=UPI001DE6D927|nr:ATP-binding protein [Pseudomonas brassicacearum]CAH0218496.1 Osmolarity sensor protein EnvZ [Pseudomonas brassicacearum]